MAPECVEMYLEVYFFILGTEFESVETFPGFARLHKTGFFSEHVVRKKKR